MVQLRAAVITSLVGFCSAVAGCTSEPHRSATSPAAVLRPLTDRARADGSASGFLAKTGSPHVVGDLYFCVTGPGVTITSVDSEGGNLTVTDFAYRENQLVRGGTGMGDADGALTSLHLAARPAITQTCAEGEKGSYELLVQVSPQHAVETTRGFVVHYRSGKASRQVQAPFNVAACADPASAECQEFPKSIGLS